MSPISLLLGDFENIRSIVPAGGFKISIPDWAPDARLKT